MAPANPVCPRCGTELVLEMEPRHVPDARARVLGADPPYRFVCPAGCALG
ncbi:hypothetical protein [Nocardioides korecus]